MYRGVRARLLGMVVGAATVDSMCLTIRTSASSSSFTRMMMSTSSAPARSSITMVAGVDAGRYTDFIKDKVCAATAVRVCHPPPPTPCSFTRPLYRNMHVSCNPKHDIGLSWVRNKKQGRSHPVPEYLRCQYKCSPRWVPTVSCNVAMPFRASRLVYSRPARTAFGI